MSEEPSLPFPPTPNRPLVRAVLHGREIIGSGTAVVRRGQEFVIQVADLNYDVVFEDDAEKTGIKPEKTGEKRLKIILRKFVNPLGTSLNEFPMGEVGGIRLWLSLFVEAPNTEIKVVSYTIYWGGTNGG